MEYNLPPVVTPERFPEPENPAKRKRWNLFETFRKKEQGQELAEPRTPAIEQAAAVLPERSQEAPQQRRRFGESIMRLLRGERLAPEAPAAAFFATKPEKEPAMPRPPERIAQARAEKPVVETEQQAEPGLIERAQEMGRGVLTLLGRVKRDVVAADERERVVSPTDIDPLADADERVRAAMQELIAPIEAYAAERGIAMQPEAPATSVQAAADVMPVASGGDAMPGVGRRAPLFEATAAAATAAEIMTNKMERQTSRRQRLGLFAVGAATVGVLIYSWHRQREIRKEQKALKKEHKKFEREVRDYQRKERRRIEELEKVQVGSLSQAQRQEHVHEVSRFAVTQAEAIHAVAQRQEERVQIRTSRPTIERPVASPTMPTRLRTESLQPFAVPAEAPKAEKIHEPFMPVEAPRRTLVEREVQGAERRSVVEKAMEAITRPKAQSAAEGGGLGGGLGGFADTLINLTKGQAPDEPAQTQQAGQQTPQPATTKQRTGQEWLLGVGLAIGVVGVVLLLINFL